jgi:hypothetical protein
MIFPDADLANADWPKRTDDRNLAKVPKAEAPPAQERPVDPAQNQWAFMLFPHDKSDMPSEPQSL